MPRALEPTQTFPIWLDFDADKPEAKRPTFYFRSISVRDWKKVRASLLENQEADAWDATLALLRASLVGWDHINDPQTGEAIPYNPDDLDRVLDFAEASELLAKLQFGARDKKKFG